MINLKLGPDQTSEQVALEAPAYPYGTRIELEGEHLSQIDKEIEVGEFVEIRGIAEVVSHNVNQGENSESESMGFQLVEIEVMRKEGGDAASVLYD